MTEVEERMLDTLFVDADRSDGSTSARSREHRSSVPRHWDLLHTDLEISLNWQREQVIGTAKLSLTPFAYPQQSLVLDAKSMQWEALQLDGQLLQQGEYSYDGSQLSIRLPAMAQPGDTVRLKLQYRSVACKAEKGDIPNAERGYFFITADTDSNRQFWTQGETTHNSRWFPTLDQPNERSTQRLRITVDSSMQTLSNGLLTTVELHEDGTRSDTWQLSTPHAPYLFMLAVGRFAVRTDHGAGVPLRYWVNPNHEEDAGYIFRHSAEMVKVFSQKLQVPFPWPKYDQIIVRHFVSGAMENTTASVFAEAVQRKRGDLIDAGNDNIVAHELFHQWFGNYVTCESWSQLTLNEGLATYGEYIWLEHKYGRDRADAHLRRERDAYFGAAAMEAHRLIRQHYNNPEELFDAHSYNKGAAVLHMLRRWLGDKVFYAGLARYLQDNALQSVEMHHLRLAFEACSGLDLQWFFDQWFLQRGHPVIQLRQEYDSLRREAILTVEQQQDESRFPAVYCLPVQIDVYEGDTVQRYSRTITERSQSFRFACATPPELIRFDADDALLARVKEQKTTEEWMFQYRHTSRYRHRWQALQRTQHQDSRPLQLLRQEALGDAYHGIRNLALYLMPADPDDDTKQRIAEMALRDPHADVRITAMERLALQGQDGARRAAERALQQDSVYRVVGKALQLLRNYDEELVLQHASRLENSGSQDILLALGSIFVETQRTDSVRFFLRHLPNIKGADASRFYQDYQDLALQASAEEAERALQALKKIAATSEQGILQRYGAAQAINEMRNHYRREANASSSKKRKATLEARVERISKILEELRTGEQDERLRSLYRQLGIVRKV